MTDIYKLSKYELKQASEWYACLLERDNLTDELYEIIKADLPHCCLELSVIEPDPLGPGHEFMQIKLIVRHYSIKAFKKFVYPMYTNKDPKKESIKELSQRVVQHLKQEGITP